MKRKDVRTHAGTIATGACAKCGRGFTYGPASVPTDNDKPLCQMCVEHANIDRAALGVPLITYPASAYP